ncbi:MAG: protein kinase [Leptolyngbyaceae cyanobacterium bins.349]|nr:protein kinase [Leptolyngbyaceae cyanobacterium bins.349]
MISLTLLHPQTSKPLRQWRFETETTIRIGRAPENHIILNDPIVSRFHLELRRLAPSQHKLQTDRYVWQLINHSTNGTFLDGAAIAQGILDDDAQIQLAQDGPILQFHRRAPSPTTTAAPPPRPGATPSANLTTSAPTRCTHTGNPPDNLFCVHCGQPVAIEKSIRNYQVLRVLGRGGMGTTYLVWHPTSGRSPTESQIGRLQVLKEMNADIARIPKAQELFEREANTLKTLNHPGVPKYYDFFIEEGKKYLVMELVHGRDLEKRVRQEGAVSVQQAIAWMIQTCEVLDYLHTRPTPIIHRDIKPGNLLVRNIDQRIVVLDFGAVKAAGMPPGTRIGAEGYGAPEQIQGRPLVQSDLYAIGPSLVFLLTGMNPLRLQKREDPYHRLDLDQIAGLPRRLHLIIQRLTEPDPGDRYQTAKELIRALKSCQ